MLPISYLQQQPYASLSNFPHWIINPYTHQVNQIQKTCDLIKLYYHTELFTPIDTKAPEGSSKTWLRYLTDIDEDKPVSYNSSFLCCFLLALAVDNSLSFEQKRHSFALTLGMLNEGQASEFHQQLTMLPPVISTHILLYSSMETDIILDQITTAKSALSFIEAIFENVWSLKEQSKCLEKLYDHFQLFTAKDKESLFSYINSHASKELLLWINLASPELYKKITLFPRIPLKHINDKA